MRYFAYTLTGIILMVTCGEVIAVPPTTTLRSLVTVELKHEGWHVEWKSHWDLVVSTDGAMKNQSEAEHLRGLFKSANNKIQAFICNKYRVFIVVDKSNDSQSASINDGCAPLLTQLDIVPAAK